MTAFPVVSGGIPGIPRSIDYKEYLQSRGLEFHTEIFDLVVDPVAQSGANIAAGGVVVATVRISQEADFVSEKWVFTVAPLGAVFQVRITDNSTGRTLSNIPVDINNVAGTAQRPRILKPRMFRRNADVSFEFTNTSGAIITGLQFCMSGYKIFDKNALNLNNPQA
jgi:hypothetical protein